MHKAFRGFEYETAQERGSALVYILIAIALLAALTVSFMEPSSQQTQSQSSFKLVSEMSSQVDFIRSSVQECVIIHPAGDNTIPNGPAEANEGANRRFPIDPRAAHIATPSTEPDPLVRELKCPGNPGPTIAGGPGNNDHAPIFAGASGKFLPPPPAIFNDWQWYNGKDGIFFWTSTQKTDAYIESSLIKLEEEFGKCEADTIITAGVPKDLDNDGTISCPSNSYCFRVWMVIDNETTIDVEESLYPDEAGCPP